MDGPSDFPICPEPKSFFTFSVSLVPPYYNNPYLPRAGAPSPILQQLDEMSTELDRLRIKIDKLDQPSGEVVEMPNPLKRRA
jgi:hypothetical protein